MKIFFDTEFYENGKTIDLISIGMVREDGVEYYAETVLAQRLCLQSAWLIANVKPHLRGESAVRYTPDIGGDLVAFAGEKPEFWADYASYDWVCLCQIFGTMLQLPKGWPMFVRDIQQLRNGIEVPRFPNEAEHDALADARNCKQKYDWLADRV